MNKKRGVKSLLSKKVSNRLSYTIITAFALIFIAFGVYAALGTTPNPGHPVSELQPCTVSGEILKSDGSTWTCATDDSGSSFWNQTGSNIYYGSGKVGIGTTIPNSMLSVGGSGVSGTAIYANGQNQGISAAGLTGLYSLGQTIGVDAVSSSGVGLRATGAAGFPAIIASGNVEIAGNISISGDITGNNAVTGTLTVGTGILSSPKVYTAFCDNGVKSHSPGGSYLENQHWCGTTQTGLTTSNCVPFLIAFSQIADNDWDDVVSASCSIDDSTSRLYSTIRTEGSDDETNIGVGSICGAVCGVSPTSI